jgi:hypothetical protein
MDLTLSKEEFFELRQCVGEFRRICRDQVYRYVGGDYQKSDNEVSNKRLEIAESLVAALDRIEWLNNNIK